jgi:hypothetical protein
VFDRPPEAWIGALEALRLATEGSAAVLGMTGRIGKIAPGHKADLVFLDLDSVNLVPLNNAVQQLVNTEDGASVRDVMIGGRFVLRDGVLTGIDWPRIAARAATGVVATVAQVVRLSALGCAGLALCIGLLAPAIIGLLYGEAFLPAVTPLRILLAEAVVTGATNVIVQAYNATGRPGRASVLFAINIAVAGAAMVVLVPAFGAAGAAAAALAGALVRLGCALAGIPIVLRHPLPRLLPDRRDLAWVLGR